MLPVKVASSNTMAPSTLLICLLCLITVSGGRIASGLAFSQKINVGAMFGPNELQQELVFKAALKDLNENAIEPVMPKSMYTPQVENVAQDDSFDADRKACNLLKMGVVGILGPLNGAASQHVIAICDSLEVPHIEIKPELMLKRFDLAINLYPSYNVLARAYIDLIQAWNWTSFAIVYESSEAMIRLQDIFKELSGANTKKWTIKLFQLQANSTFRDLFWSVKKSGENNILLDVNQENLYDCLKQAQQVGLMTEKQNYLITSLDLPTIDLDDFRYGRTKITGLQLVNRKSEALKNIIEELNSSGQLAKFKNFSSTDLLVQSALIYDAVNLLANGIRELSKGLSEPANAQSLSCDNSDITWQYGSSLINYMRLNSFDGITGRVLFDQTGRRSNVTFDVVALGEHGLEYIGKWREYSSVNLDIDNVKFNRFYVAETDTIDTLVVTAIRTHPYFMLKSTPNKQEGNDRYEGYAVDLIHEISRIVGFKYKFKEVSDLKYGVKDVRPNGTVTWSGMIGEITSGQADLAIADLTITSSREEAVDFTLPFMNTGISIVFKKPTNKVTTLFSFLSPFSLDVWVYVLCAYSGVSVILFIVGHISPYEWTNPYPCRQEDSAVMKNSFSLLNSFWFTIGSLMQQGSDLAPKSMSTRAMASTWYFFTLIMISSYTANLAAFLTVEKIVYPIENAKDLSEQTEIKYGCVESGSTRTFFKDSQIETYKKIFQFMETHKTYVRSNDEGKERVEQGNFAFFMESTTIEYITERHCNLTQIGSPLDSKNYGIALRKHPPYRRPYRMLLSQAILQLQENGLLHVLKNRWWKERHGVGSCIDEKGGGVTELSLANVGGVFVVLLGGMGLAFILALFESFTWLMRRKMGRDPMCEQMMQDLKFALSCQSSTKPTRKRVLTHNMSESLDRD